ncbi:hypothetical protein F0562_028762 [Nyssa sinensis]|uniref:Uncharacterized protein n=1 Tax=Nyssa sinensis TaxID=561372 RepID=A0A5J5B0Z9_9ASTE|nr:hypothetical protein F0562_028762 [Nyssa sinensis]
MQDKVSISIVGGGCPTLKAGEGFVIFVAAFVALIGFNKIMQVSFMSPATVAAFAAVFLDSPLGCKVLQSTSLQSNFGVLPWYPLRVPLERQGKNKINKTDNLAEKEKSNWCGYSLKTQMLWMKISYYSLCQ